MLKHKQPTGKDVTMTALDDAKSKLMEVYQRGGYRHSKHAVNYVPTHFPRFKHTIDQLVPQLKPGSDILDLGAAPFIVPECLSKLGHMVVGGDFCASDWLEPGLLSFKTVQLDCNGKKLPFDDRAFDCVVFCEVFEHMNKNLNLTMREILISTHMG